MGPSDRLIDLLDLDKGLIGAEVFTDDEIYKREMRDLFGQTWLFLAHESRLAKPGDFSRPSWVLTPSLSSASATAG